MSTASAQAEIMAAQVQGQVPVPTTSDAQSSIKQEPSKIRTDNYDSYSVKVKPEFVLNERAPCLAPILETPTNANVDDRDGGSNGKKRRKKGMNKKRPRDAKPVTKMCQAILHGKECSFGADKCKYSHDLKEAITTRPADIAEVEGGCPNYNLKGFCEYGVNCRVGANHLNMATGDSLKRDDVTPVQAPVIVMNVLSRELQDQLRKHKYPFKCKRFNEKKSETSELGAEVSSPVSELPTDFSPLPTKRKLIDFRNRIYVAPLTTVGNLPFRRIMKRYGADITCGEMAVATNLLEGRPSEWALLKRHPDEDIFGVQITGGFADQCTRVCELLEAHTTVNFVDLNLGCPLDIICNRGAGASLMMRDKKLKACLEGITSTLSCPITIKMRTGWDEGKPFAHSLVPKIQSWGLDGIAAIMIHGRSRLQRYSRSADWDYISTVALSQSGDAKDRIPVIGNGDIFSFTDYEDKIAREGVEATAMLARGALIKPWLPTEIKERRHLDISASERLDMLKTFVKFGLEHWGSDQLGVNHTRRFLLEWLSFLHRYVPVGLLEVLPQQMNQRPPVHMCGRSDLETLFLSNHCVDWIKISEMLLGPVPDDFDFQPKHKANG